MDKITAVILNYNSSLDCEKCISYLRKQQYDNLELCVVDNASSNMMEVNRLEEICYRYDCELLLNNENLGYSAGNNIGMRFAEKNGSKWCLVINPDVEIRDEFYLQKAMSKIKEYPKTVVAATNVLLPSGERQNPSRELTYFDDLFWFLYILNNRRGKKVDYLSENRTGYCEKVSGCCFLIKMAFLNKIGYFDENVFLYCEEAILAKQVQKYDFKELYISELTAYHHHVPSEKGSTSKRMQLLLQSRCYYLKNYSGYRGIKLALVLTSKRIQSFVWRVRK